MSLRLRALLYGLLNPSAEGRLTPDRALAVLRGELPAPAQGENAEAPGARWAGEGGARGIACELSRRAMWLRIMLPLPRKQCGAAGCLRCLWGNGVGNCTGGGANRRCGICQQALRDQRALTAVKAACIR